MMDSQTTSNLDRAESKRMILSAFDMHTVGHQNPGMWRHPEDESHRYKDLDYWVELAQLLERGGFDCLFVADILGFHDEYRKSRDTVVSEGAQSPLGDPLLTISAMAAATERLGFGVTASITYELPYSFARKMSTLDHLTKGRVAWNIVTSHNHSAAINLGLDGQIPHNERYDRAEEFMEVCYKLWEGSWEDDAVVRDPDKGIFTDPGKVHNIEHHGKYFKVPGAHLAEPSPQRTPFLLQAGASARGRKFAAQHAEAVFLIGTNPEDMRPIVDQLRMQIAEEGRDPRSVKILMMITAITAETDDQVQAKLDDIEKYSSHEAALALFGGWTGVDLSVVDPDMPLEHFQGDSVRAFSDLLTRVDSELVWTPRKLAEWLCVGGMSATAIGTPEVVVNELERWMEVADVDGFNFSRIISPGTMTDFVDLVVPELKRRGLVPEEPIGPRTMRERFGSEGPGLPASHGGSTYKKGHEVVPKKKTATVTIEARPRKFGVLALLKPKPGKAEALVQWLEEGLDVVMGEPGTTSWYSFKIDDETYGIYDTFNQEDGRQAHLNGRLIDSLREIAQDYLAEPPSVRQVDLLAVKSG